MSEHIQAICCVCGSNFGEGPEEVECRRILLPHLAAAYECICLECVKVIADAAEE